LVASSFTLDRSRAGGEPATDLAGGFAMADSVTVLDKLRATTDYLQRRLRPNPSSGSFSTSAASALSSHHFRAIPVGYGPIFGAVLGR
jgi:hypothetical protein